MARKIGMLQERTVAEVQGVEALVVHVAGRGRCLACARRNNSSTSNQVVASTINADVISNVDNVNAEAVMNNRYDIDGRNMELININTDAQRQSSVSANVNVNIDVDYNTGQPLTAHIDDLDGTNRRLRIFLGITLLINYITNTNYL